jgi:hypothetical protein
MGALERRHRQQRDLPQSGSDLMLNDRHRRLRRASAGRLRGSTPDRDRPVQSLTGAGWEPQREGWHRPGRRLGSPLRRLAGLPGGRPVLRLRCRAWPRGAGVLPAGAGTGTGRRGRALVDPLTGPTARSQAKLNLELRLSPWAHWGPWLPERWVRRAGRSPVRAWRRAWRWGRFRVRCRLRRAGWRSPGRSGDLAISRSRRRGETGGPRRERRVPSPGEGRWARSSPVPWTWHHPPAKKAGPVGPRRTTRQDGPERGAGWDARGRQARQGLPARTAQRDSVRGQRRQAVAAPRRPGQAAPPRSGQAALLRWGLAAARQQAPVAA